MKRKFVKSFNCIILRFSWATVNIDLCIPPCYNQVNSNRVFNLKTKFPCTTVSNGAIAPFGTFFVFCPREAG